MFPKIANFNFSARAPAPTRWVFGGKCPVQNRGFAVTVDDRSAVTLEPLIMRFIAPGSIINHDLWYAIQDTFELNLLELLSLLNCSPGLCTTTSRISLLILHTKSSQLIIQGSLSPQRASRQITPNGIGGPLRTSSTECRLRIRTLKQYEYSPKMLNGSAMKLSKN